MAARLVPERGGQILDAASELLKKGGLQAVTTAALARKAKCSKDTLYTLFKDRDAILAALVERQASALNATIDEMDPASSPGDALIAAGAQLLELLISDAALAINRAALADASGALSRILIDAGKNRSAPKIMSLIRQMDDQGDIAVIDVTETYRTFYGLLIGDRQILALHRVKDAGLNRESCSAIARRAVRRLVLLYPASRSAP